MSKYFKKVLNKQMEAELGLRLVNKDMLNDSSLMQLTEDVIEFVHSLIKNKNKVEVLEFLKLHKSDLSIDMRTMISEELKSLNPGKI